MARPIYENLEEGLDVRTKINKGFKESYLFRSISELQTEVATGSEPLTVGDVVKVKGYYEGDGAEHKRIISSSDDGSGILLASGKFANILYDGYISPLWFGCKADGITDDYTNFNKALNYTQNLPKIYSTDRHVLDLKNGVYRISTGQLIIYSNKIQVIGNSATLNFSGHDGSADYYIKIIDDGGITGFRTSSKTYFEGVEITGRGKAVTTNNNGILFDTPVDVDPNNQSSTATFRLSNIVVRDCYIGLDWKDNAYNTDIQNANIYKNAIGVRIQDAPNMFERITFINSTIFENTVGFDVTGKLGTLYLMATSVDYNTKAFKISDANVELHGCHIENRLTTEPFIELEYLSSFKMIGGWWVMLADGSTTTTQEAKLDLLDSSSAIIFDKVRFSGSNQNVVFTENPSNLSVVNCVPDEDGASGKKSFKYRFANYNAIKDTYFESGEFNFDSYLFGASKINKYQNNDDNVYVVTGDPSNAFSGDNYIKFDKTSVVSTVVTLDVLVPITNYETYVQYSTAIKGDVSATGTFFAQLRYVTATPNENFGTDFNPYIITNEEVNNENTLSLSTSYQEIEVEAVNKAKPYHTHALIRLSLFGIEPGTVYIGKLSINKM